MVLHVCDIFDLFRLPLIPSLSDKLDCGDWLLFEVRIHHDRGATTLIWATDPSSSGRIGEGSGSS